MSRHSQENCNDVGLVFKLNCIAPLPVGTAAKDPPVPAPLSLLPAVSVASRLLDAADSGGGTSAAAPAAELGACGADGLPERRCAAKEAMWGVPVSLSSSPGLPAWQKGKAWSLRLKPMLCRCALLAGMQA